MLGCIGACPPLYCPHHILYDLHRREVFAYRFRCLRSSSKIPGVHNADPIPQGHETESTASKASGLYEAWHRSSKDVLPSVKIPPKNLRPLKGLKLRLLGLLANGLL